MKILSTMMLLLFLLWIGPLHAESDEAALHNKEGAKLVEEGKMEEALEAFKKAVELNSNDAVVRLNLAYTYDRQGMAEEAIAEYQRAIELSPSNLLGYNNLGVLYDKMGLYDEAIGEFQRALEIDPTDANALKNLENAKQNKTVIEEREGQIAELRREIEAHPDNPTALYNLGRLYAFYDEKDQALEWINKALDKGYDALDYIKVDPALEKLRGDPRFEKMLPQ
jgi:tetratricopeptide (TPR) repeat protein